MHVQVVIHASFERPGIIEQWAEQNKHTLSCTHTYRGEALPNISEIDFLIIMGGPQSPLEQDIYPYLSDEIALAKLAINKGIPIIGICLGAQIISESMGAKTEHSPHKEIGVFPIHLTEDGLNDPVFQHMPLSFDVMHWHNDMPGVPEGAKILAYSEGCPRQVIRYNERTYGLQCHMEMTAELVTGMVKHCSADLKPGPYIQNSKQMLEANLNEINNRMVEILDKILLSTGLKMAETCAK